MVRAILFSPPIAFIIIVSAVIAVSWLCSKHTREAREKMPSGAKKAYACGEDFNGHLIQPDYSQFFPFAFFFTILHVVALVIATVPRESIETFSIAVVYVVGAIIGLFILLRQ